MKKDKYSVKGRSKSLIESRFRPSRSGLVASLLITGFLGLGSLPGCSLLTGPSKEKEQIAFLSNRDQGTGEIYTGETSDSGLVNVKRLTHNVVNDLYPSFSPDGSQMVISSNREDTSGDGLLNNALFIMKFDGSNPRRITPSFNGILYAGNSVWANNRKIYFNFWDYNNTQGIASVNEDGTGYEKIIERPFFNWLSGKPACSPDGSQVAFTDKIEENIDIYLVNSNGDKTSLRRLTSHPSGDAQPVWYENEIFFISYRDGTADIWAIKSNGTGLRKILESSEIEVDINISSDGSKLIFTRGINMSNPQLYSIGVDGTELRQLTFGGAEGANCYPAWRPRPPN